MTMLETITEQNNFREAIVSDSSVYNYSGFFKLDELNRNTTTVEALTKTSTHFSRQGRPSKLQTDVGPRYMF